MKNTVAAGNPRTVRTPKVKGVVLNRIEEQSATSTRNFFFTTVTGNLMN